MEQSTQSGIGTPDTNFVLENFQKESDFEKPTYQHELDIANKIFECNTVNEEGLHSNKQLYKYCWEDQHVTINLAYLHFAPKYTRKRIQKSFKLSNSIVYKYSKCLSKRKTDHDDKYCGYYQSIRNEQIKKSRRNVFDNKRNIEFRKNLNYSNTSHHTSLSHVPTNCNLFSAFSNECKELNTREESMLRSPFTCDNVRNNFNPATDCTDASYNYQLHEPLYPSGNC